jgi:hypothetical protein
MTSTGDGRYLPLVARVDVKEVIESHKTRASKRRRPLVGWARSFTPQGRLDEGYQQLAEGYEDMEKVHNLGGLAERDVISFRHQVELYVTTVCILDALTHYVQTSVTRSLQEMGTRKGRLPRFVYMYFNNPREFTDKARKFNAYVKVRKAYINSSNTRIIHSSLLPSLRQKHFPVKPPQDLPMVSSISRKSTSIQLTLFQDSKAELLPQAAHTDFRTGEPLFLLSLQSIYVWDLSRGATSTRCRRSPGCRQPTQASYREQTALLWKAFGR